MFPVLKTRIRIPTNRDAPRPRLMDRLRSETGAIALVGGPGFGKTALAAQFAARFTGPKAWLSLADPEDDPHSLLCYLRAAWLAALPGLDTEALDAGLRAGVPQGRWRHAADALWAAVLEVCECGEGEQGSLLVLDDVQHLSGDGLAVADYLMRFLPESVTLVMTCRTLPRLSIHNSLTRIGADFLAMTEDEIAELGLAEPAGVLEKTQGWPLAVDWWRRHGAFQADQFPQELWAQLTPNQRSLLERSSVLEYLSLEACRTLCPELPIDQLWEEIAQQGVLVQSVGEGYLRIHPYVREVLLARLQRDRAAVASAHRAAAPIALSSGDFQEAYSHMVAGQSTDEAYQLVLTKAQELLESGGYRKLAQWIEGLPAEVFNPEMHLYHGLALRGTHQFEQALAALEKAIASDEASIRTRAVLETAKLYVDTLQPRLAHQYLRQAYRLVGEDQRVEVLDLFAENLLNQGRTRHSLRFREWAERLAPGRQSSHYEARSFLRRGQLEQARQAIQAQPEGPPSRGSDGHRQNQLILAYLDALEGHAERAESLARSSLIQSQRQQSDFGQAVSWMRLGHALQLREMYAEAENSYTSALNIVDQLGAPRVRGEALMGMALLNSTRGDWAASYRLAMDGLELTRQSGDEWISAWLSLVLGIAAHQGLHPEAASLLASAREAFQGVHDRFGAALAELWQALERKAPLDGPAQRCRDLGFGFVLERPTLFGPRSLSAAASKAGCEPVVRICVLGSLQLFRNGQEVPQKAWKRKKARELLCLLVSLRGAFISKEQLWEIMFPESPPESAGRDLRVILHSLFEVLDPDRPHNSPARSIVRKDDLYSLPWNRISLDLADFEACLDSPQEAPITVLARANNLVRGDCLEDFAYSDWAQSLRQRWRDQYLRAASQLAQLQRAQGHPQAALEVAHQMLERDKCWEEAYRLMMEIHLDEGRPAQAAQVYDLCSRTLQEELGVEPSSETEALFAVCLENRHHA